ncbi:hypothetical protein CFK38_01485 [Brachybacterium vulturis]|uniref:DUF4383 domain-containing protein n=1 Tax=Brachybacterium vulturis TaxID=2017484 RepID=A0A291GJW1_9MICO|nr:DUF4383 domain-containing protein [Brachybacterium vulturis]ATG50342.1 hypothetical protein CFK38_01485 [Brachybacterium vulturis]
MFIDGPVDPPLTRANEDPARAPVRWAAIVCGLFFLAIGFAGFVPGVTSNFNAIEMGYGSGAMVLGIFQVSMLHNIIHLLLGVAGFAQSRFSHSARRYLRIAGGLAAVLWLFGLLVDPSSMANFVPLNAVDTWAYFVLALVVVGLSFLPGDATSAAARSARRI